MYCNEFTIGRLSRKQRWDTQGINMSPNKFASTLPSLKRLSIFIVIALLSAAILVSLGNKALRYYFNPTRNNPEGNLVILTASWCPYCIKLKELLQDANFPYREIDIETNWQASLAFKSLNGHGTPLIIIGENV